MSIEDEQAKHEALEQYMSARQRHLDDAAELLDGERFEPWYVEIGAFEMLRRRMEQELDVVPHG